MVRMNTWPWIGWVFECFVIHKVEHAELDEPATECDGRVGSYTCAVMTSPGHITPVQRLLRRRCLSIRGNQYTSSAASVHPTDRLRWRRSYCEACDKWIAGVARLNAAILRVLLPGSLIERACTMRSLSSLNCRMEVFRRLY